METYFPTNTQHIPGSELQPGGGDAGNRKEIENCQSLEHLVLVNYQVRVWLLTGSYIYTKEQLCKAVISVK